jgi:hypothetical protein
MASFAGEARAQCLNNVVANGNFDTGVVPGSMPAGSVSNWSLLTASPQVVPGCNGAGGGLQMWGNLVVGESAKQTLPGPGIQAGKTYRVSLLYRMQLPAPDPQDEVSVRLAASVGAPAQYPPVASYDVIGVTPLTASANCISHTFPLWTAPNNAGFLTVNPENDSAINDGGQVSWALVDDVCIQEAVLEHFAGYQIKTSKGTAKFAKFGPVVLADQFGSGKYDVLKPRELLLPANKNNEGVLDEDTHLKEYQIKPRAAVAVASPVHVINQCNDLVVEVRKVRSLLVPTSKTPPPGNVVPALPDPQFHNLDHFLCYQAGAAKVDGNGIALPKFPRGMQVDVVDQFQTRRYDLKKITKLCNPVDKASDPLDPPVVLSGADAGTAKPIQPAAIRNPDDHLVCYQAKVAKNLIVQNGCGCDTVADPKCKGLPIAPAQPKHAPLLGINVNNQFGPEVVDTSKEVEICIPSQKLLIP